VNEDAVEKASADATEATKRSAVRKFIFQLLVSDAAVLVVLVRARLEEVRWGRT